MQEIYEIHDLTSDGRGVARRADGRVILVDGALPGDHVIVTVRDPSAHGALAGRVEEVMIPSPDRVPHPCPHHRDGCPASLLGALRYEAALKLKCRHIEETLKRIGKLPAPRLAPPVPSEQHFGYRDRLEFHLTRLRREWRLGYRLREQPFPIGDCLLGSEHVRLTLRALNAGLKEGLLPAPEGRWNRGLRLLIRDNGHGSAVVVLFVAANRPVNPEPFVRWLSSVDAAGWEIRRTPSLNARFFNSRIERRVGDSRIALSVGEQSLTCDPTVFSQANREMGKRLVDKVISEIPRGDNLLDLYGGYGAFALRHGLHGGEATVVESSHEAILAGRRFAREHNLKVHYIEGDLGRRSFFDASPARFDSVILDPPRRGVHAGILQKLNESGPPRIVYVSCHPAALARDLVRLPGYSPEGFIPFDLFPQTPDIETIAVLTRNGEKR